ncbi:MAG: tRNA (adenosine(37)-N6)-dimethylallyltransferase MiaA [Candidatus Hydrogenedens sp.]
MDAIAVVGPTASGKTALSIRLAEEFNSEIISADSMQFYQGMEIGTAVPSLEIRKRIPHHFLVFVPPDFHMNAGLFQDLARKELHRIKDEGRIPIIVGGSGLYLSALIDGLFEGPASSDAIRNKLKKQLSEQGPEYLIQILKDVDPIYFSKLTSPNDITRVIRALEVYELTGIPFSEWHKKHQQQAQPLHVLQIALNWERDILYERINNRVDEMIEKGWIDEVKTLLEKGYEKDIHRLKALGYREILYFLKGTQDISETIANIKLHHRRYAKRQITWFRSDKRVQWIDANTDKSMNDLLNSIYSLIESFNKNSISENYRCFLFRNY